jgi:predicted Zn finger-like uncharacterized protein
MKFVCDRCQTKYSIADDRVRGKILKVKCKSCANVITVREPRRPSAGYSTVNATGHDSERTVLAPNPGMMAEAVFAPAPAPAHAQAPAPARQTGAHAVPTAPDDGLAWYMALSGERSGPFSRKQLVEKLFPLPKNADVHVWNEKLGDWKPPTDVSAVAADLAALAARRRAPPPLPPGAPRRPTPSPPPPPVGALADKPARVTGAMAAIGSPLHPGGIKLPPPSGGGHARPLAALAASAAPAHAPESGVDIDPASMLETPAPQPHMLHGKGGTNGVGHARATGAHAAASPAATRSSSDVLKLLNLPGAAESTPGAPPRLISSSEAVGWSPSAAAPAARGRTAKLVLACIGVVAVICIVGAFGLTGKKRDPLPPPAPKAAVTDPLAGVVDKMNAPAPPTPPPVVAPVPDPPSPPPPPAGRGKAGKGRLAKGRGTAPVTVAAAASPTPVVDTNARYKDTGPGIKVTPTSAAPNRPPPSQSEISSVINNNRSGIKNCYQRALLRDNSLTHGKITVKLTLGISGRVKHAAIDGPQQFRAVEPCIKELVSRWVFPQASDEYGTEFVYVFQGNE